MKKTLAITFLLLFYGSLNAQNNVLSKTEIEDYTQQIKTMVNYLEETFSFIGNPENSAQEKDIIFRDSYLKIFRDEDVQIEDDLDENRRTYINKNVQAYLKDIDFFFKDIKFTFDTEDITTQTNDDGDTFFKVTITRQIAGHNIMGDTVNNSLKRYIEINVDPFKKDLKIASIYSTKLNEKKNSDSGGTECLLSGKCISAKNSMSSTHSKCNMWLTSSLTPLLSSTTASSKTLSLATWTSSITNSPLSPRPQALTLATNRTCTTLNHYMSLMTYKA